MAAGTVTLAECRQEVIRQLYADMDVIVAAATATATTSLTHLGTLANDSISLESGLNSTFNFVGIHVYVPVATAPAQTRIASYDIGGGVVTFATALGSDPADTATYEMHYDLPPDRVNEIIADVARQATHGALTTIAESTAIPLDKFTLASGVLDECYRAIAIGKQDRVQKAYLGLAKMYEAFFLSGLALEGYQGTYRDGAPADELELLRPKMRA